MGKAPEFASPTPETQAILDQERADGLHTLSPYRQFAERVEPNLFVQVHRRWLVKESAIAELRTRGPDGPEVVLQSGKHLPAGRVYLKQLRKIVHLPRQGNRLVEQDNQAPAAGQRSFSRGIAGIRN